MTSLFGGLAGDYINGGLSRTLFEYSPTLKSLLKRIERVKSASYNREQIVETLKLQNSKWNADSPALSNIRRLQDANTVIVSCGHQCCLAGGPLYVAYKILTAVNTANLIERETGTQAVPLFWLASDDDDITEISTLNLSDNGQIAFNADNFKGCAAYLPSPVTQLSTVPKIKASDWEEYHAKLLVNFFSPLGVVLISPLQASTRQLRQPFFDAYAKHKHEISEALAKQTDKLAEAGFKQQVKLKAEDAHCYRIEGQKRYRLKKSDQFPPSNEMLSSALTRLLSIEYMLPIAAEVSGPSEIAYHAQTKMAYETLDREMPVIIPRSSNTLVYKSQKGALTKSDISIESAIAPKSKIEFSENQAMDQFDSLFEEFNADIDKAFSNLRETYLEAAPGLATAFEASRRKAASVSVYLHKKLESSIRKSTVNDNHLLTGTLNFLYPAAPQERVFAFFPFLEKNESFLMNIAEYCQPFDNEHHIIEIEEQ